MEKTFKVWAKRKMYGNKSTREEMAQGYRSIIEECIKTRDFIIEHKEELNGMVLNSENEQVFNELKEKYGVGDDRMIDYYHIHYCGALWLEPLDVDKAAHCLDEKIEEERGCIDEIERMTKCFDEDFDIDTKVLSDFCKALDKMSPMVRNNISNLTIGKLYEKWSETKNNN